MHGDGPVVIALYGSLAIDFELPLVSNGQGSKSLIPLPL